MRLSRYSIMFIVVLLIVPFVVAAPSQQPLCGRCPICDRWDALWKPSPCWWMGTMKRDHKPERILDCINFSLAQIVGQQHVVTRVRELLVQKLMHLNEPLRLHFAGDNGVGKTFLARLLSLATSLYLNSRCRKNGNSCDMGENILQIEATSYLGVDNKVAREKIVQRTLEHLREFPHGIILVDDISAMNAGLVDLLAPLMGRGSYFAEDDKVNLDDAIIILTSDFGHSGLTQSMTLEQVEEFVMEETSGLYKIAKVTRIPMFPFLPFDRKATEELVVNTVRLLPCRIPNVRQVTMDEKAVNLMVSQLEADGKVFSGNGRDIMFYVTKQVVDPAVSGYLLVNGKDNVLVVHITEGSDGKVRVIFRSPSTGEEL